MWLIIMMEEQRTAHCHAGRTEGRIYIDEWRHIRPDIQVRYEGSVEVPRRGVKLISLDKFFSLSGLLHTVHEYIPSCHEYVSGSVL